MGRDAVAAVRLRLAAEVDSEILKGQEIRQDLGDGRGHRVLKMADLEAVRQAIKDLQREISSATANAAGGFGYALANLSGES